MTEPAVLRCRAGRRCQDAETVVDPDTGEKTDRLGAVIEQGPLCEVCVRAAVTALGQNGLAADLVGLRGLMQPSSMRQHFADPDMPSQPRVKKAAPLPFREEVYTLIELIDYETTIWAESVADADQVEWDSYAAEHSRPHDRVQRATALLGHRLTTLLHLPVQQHRAHSLTTNPADGHDPDTTTRYRGDYWANRPGWEALVRFVELHQRATRMINPIDHNRVPCPRCHEPRLEREHHNNRIVCRACLAPMSDDDYDAFITHALEAHPGPGTVVTRAQAAAILDVKPLTIKKLVQRGHFKPLPTGGYRRQEIIAYRDRDTPTEEAA